MSWNHQKVLEGLEQKGYVICDAIADLLLTDEILSDFISNISTQKEAFKKSGVGKTSEIQSSIRGDFISWLNPEKLNFQQKKVFEVLDEIKNELNKKFFLGLREFECHMTYYPPETFYQKHLDTFRDKDETQTPNKRKISFILYLNKDWQKADGGELVLYNKDDVPLLKVEPHFGTMILFMSEEFPHEVLINHKERLSFTGWMK